MTNDIDWQRVQADPAIAAKVRELLQAERKEEAFDIKAETDRRTYVLDWMGSSIDRQRPGEKCRVWAGTCWMGGTIIKLHQRGAIVDVQGVIVYASTSQIESNLTQEELDRLGVK